MRPKSLILLAFALGCGLIAAIGISQVLESRRAQNQTSDEKTDIYVAASDIERNTALSKENVTLKAFPKDSVPEGAITKLEELVGRRPNTRILKDEVLLAGKLGSGDSLQAANEIPPGFRVVTVRVKDDSGAGLILPGNRVDVQVSVRKEAGFPETGTWTFLQDISVFAVNAEIRHTEGDGDSKIDARTISLLVTPEQAAKVTLAAEVGTIKLVMRGALPEDTKYDTKISLDQLFDGARETGENHSSGTPNPDLKKWLDKQQQSARQAEATPAADNAIKMVIMDGPTARVVEFRRGDPLPHEVATGDGVGDASNADVPDGASEPSAFPETSDGQLPGESPVIRPIAPPPSDSDSKAPTDNTAT